MKAKTLISLTGLVAMLSVAAPAHAYLDPATGSIILQAVIGGIAGATLFFRTQLYRVKSFFVRDRKAGANEE
ncbi:hypothetical protein GRI62_07910 [Erythrobacter arachoides]|uniref:Uncharacterized protein n=1 Tax=Aurantiacibacter arachoides TaxID=1850444 RepID=A0A845A7K7_9SPHN|nr:hypothetical protein [Aurantiacibacter arachoides]MXO93529.1 hypothetical protein [Aurantiacibacter arachoides]GGD48656.1 hypothetical protein GCM10011411_05530 [Aurantiacibacter arachoides]